MTFNPDDLVRAAVVSFYTFLKNDADLESRIGLDPLDERYVHMDSERVDFAEVVVWASEGGRITDAESETPISRRWQLNGYAFPSGRSWCVACVETAEVLGVQLHDNPSLLVWAELVLARDG